MTTSLTRSLSLALALSGALALQAALAATPAGAKRGLAMGSAPAPEAQETAPVPAAHANAHALIMAVGTYPTGVPSLSGTRIDIDNAIAMARGFGVPDAHVTVLNNAELTAERLRQALQGLERLAQGDEEIFVYFSGLGSRLCGDVAGDALVLADGTVVSEAELDLRLRQLAERARRVIVFVDAGHAPGADHGAALKAKFWLADATCGKASTRGLSVGKDPYTSSNYVKLAAVGPDEPAYEATDLGSLATHAWASCLGGRALDADASSGLSVHELQGCVGAAQRALLTARLGNATSPTAVPEPAPVIGNADMVVAEAAPAASRAPDPVEAMKDILANRDDRRAVALRASQNAYRIGRDEVGFEIQSSHAGHVYLLMVGSDGTTFDLLFPNRKDGDNLIEAGATLSLPRPSWRIRAGGPAGVNHLLAIVSDAPRDFASLELRPAGPFSVAAATLGNTRGLRVATEQAAAPACQGKRVIRTLRVDDAPAPAPAPEQAAAALAPECSNSYGAAMIAIQEID